MASNNGRHGPCAGMLCPNLAERRVDLRVLMTAAGSVITRETHELVELCDECIVALAAYSTRGRPLGLTPDRQVYPADLLRPPWRLVGG